MVTEVGYATGFPVTYGYRSRLRMVTYIREKDAQPTVYARNRVTGYAEPW